jgi:Zn-finger nucleic acid-binding protein
MCGAPASSDSTRCDHCGARLATVACPSCFGMIFLGAKFCSHCGARVERAQVPETGPEPCPRCQIDMEAIVVGATNLRECPKCEGIWADTAALDQICADREKQAAVLGLPAHLPVPESDLPVETVHYVPCPVCKELMNRINFANCSHIILDVCHLHGTWFDKDELRQIVEFIRAGGMDKSRQREIDQLQKKRDDLRSAQFVSGWSTADAPVISRYDGIDIGISVVGGLLKALFKL